jgi:hypothetical protein
VCRVPGSRGDLTAGGELGGRSSGRRGDRGLVKLDKMMIGFLLPLLSCLALVLGRFCARQTEPDNRISDKPRRFHAHGLDLVDRYVNCEISLENMEILWIKRGEPSCWPVVPYYGIVSNVGGILLVTDASIYP